MLRTKPNHIIPVLPMVVGMVSMGLPVSALLARASHDDTRLNKRPQIPLCLTLHNCIRLAHSSSVTGFVSRIPRLIELTSVVVTAPSFSVMFFVATRSLALSLRHNGNISRSSTPPSFKVRIAKPLALQTLAASLDRAKPLMYRIVTHLNTEYVTPLCQTAQGRFVLQRFSKYL